MLLLSPPRKGGEMKRRAVLLLIAMSAALVVASGVALAVDKTCQPNRKCVGTKRADTLRGTSGPDRIYGLRGSDDLIGLGAGDRLFGGRGNDELWSGDPNDVGNDDGADDKLSGEGGSDVYGFGDGWGHDTIIDERIADNNTNTGNKVTFTSSSNDPGTLIVNLVSSENTPEVSDELTNNTINWDGNVIDNVLNPHTSNDSITGNNRANNIISIASFDNDTVSSAGGDDFINVQDGPGADNVNCGEGNDTVVFDDPGDIVLNCEIQNP